MKKSTLYAICILAALIAGGIIYFTFNPVESVLFPKCPFLTLTGLKCPGCGSQRAIHALLHLDILSAFQHNALLIISIPYIILLLAVKIFPHFLRFFHVIPVQAGIPNFQKKIQHQIIIYSYLVLVLIFWITRNIFGF